MISPPPLAVVVGAGVAGLSSARQLTRAGWRTLVVERAQTLREGNYVIGIYGAGYEAARRMGILDAIQQDAFAIDENIYYDRRGRELLRLRYSDVVDDIPSLSLRRSNIVDALYSTVKTAADFRFGVRPLGIRSVDRRIVVQLSDGAVIEASVLIGADGVRSACRHMLFGEEKHHLRHLGYRFAVYSLVASLPSTANLMSFCEPGRLTELYSPDPDSTAVLHVWRDHDSSYVSPEQRWDVLAEVFSESHSTVKRALDLGRRSAPPYIDTLSLVSLPVWAKDCAVLVGDAAHCLTLMSGQGASIAMRSACTGWSKPAVDSARKRLWIPPETGCGFRLKPAVGSAGNRLWIPLESGTAFRSKPAPRSAANRQRAAPGREAGGRI